MNRFAKLIIVASTLAIAAIGSTFTAQATTISAPALSLHNAPANGAAITSTIAKGTEVNVGVCNSAWCYVTVGNQKGWVETNKLSTQLAAVNSRARSMAVSGGAGGSAGATGGRTASAGLNISITIVPEKSEAKAANQSRINVAKIAPQHLR
ncbi:SH3 domain-containing protein [Bartonella sp. HY761]|uniref:SH3 domain-containing protein n=1 Tax=Bartonella sp. HY761 TaxID=2979330 RepID=UPI00220742B8|nr:SH3 domain-containing protein [Bartonella sp. HY761]UXN05783.1 SH3 domain-containing protein [Bartonella sp. HY761]